jgi:iron complex outermembrane receptor protein
MTAFYHRYDDLMALELQGRPGPPPIITRFENGMEGDSRGVEIFSQWRAVPGWTLAAGYAYIIMDITARAPVSGSDNWTMNAKFLEGNTPQSQFQLRSSHNLPYRLEFDAALYYVGELKSLDIPAYTRLDLRLGWKPVNGLDLSIVGQNLLEDQHKEFGFTSGINQTEVQRSVYGKIAWRL